MRDGIHAEPGVSHISSRADGETQPAPPVQPTMRALKSKKRMMTGSRKKNVIVADVCIATPSRKKSDGVKRKPSAAVSDTDHKVVQQKKSKSEEIIIAQPRPQDQTFEARFEKYIKTALKH